MHPTRLVFALCTIAALAACDRTQPQAPAETVAEPTVAQGAAENAPQATAPVDPNAIDTPIPDNTFKATLSIASTPHASASGSGFDIVVQVANGGAAALYGVGSKQVNIGVQILGDNDDVAASGGVRDFVRTGLPYLPPGAQSDVVVTVPADQRLDGRKLRLALVQENVRWHEDTPEKYLDLGPFRICGSQVCDASGRPLPN